MIQSRKVDRIFPFVLVSPQDVDEPHIGQEVTPSASSHQHAFAAALEDNVPSAEQGQPPMLSSESSFSGNSPTSVPHIHVLPENVETVFRSGGRIHLKPRMSRTFYRWPVSTTVAMPDDAITSNLLRSPISTARPVWDSFECDEYDVSREFSSW